MNPTKAQDVSTTAKPRVLFVDDEPLVLDGLRRSVGREFEVDVAGGGEEGLAKIKADRPYPVVVSDMRMPGMDGASFLMAVRTLSPDSVRVMLTGYADLEAAKRAVNDGQLFRFLTKPATSEELLATLRACVAQYHVARTEKELLQNTVAGAVGFMTEVLSLANPAAFSRGLRMRQYAKHIAIKLALGDTWQYEIAAMLSELGCVTLTPDLVDAVHAGQSLTPEDEKRYRDHPKIGHDLITRIPRLELVAEMVLKQEENVPIEADCQTTAAEAIRNGSEVLRVSLAFDQLLNAGFGTSEAIAELRKRSGKYDEKILGALEDFQYMPHPSEPRLVDVRELRAGMILKEDLKTVNGSLLASKGLALTPVLVAKLRNFTEKGALKGSVRAIVEVGEPYAAKAAVPGAPERAPAS